MTLDGMGGKRLNGRPAPRAFVSGSRQKALARSAIVGQLGRGPGVGVASQEAPVAHKFEIYKDKAGEFRVKFKYNAETIFSTEGYSSKASAQNAIDSIKKNGPGAETEDNT
jgi:uncharacterized protein YegP (UPF0339 family)